MSNAYSIPLDVISLLRHCDLANIQQVLLKTIRCNNNFCIIFDLYK